MNWYLKRLIQSVITVYSVVTISFALVQSMPGGPEAYLRAQLAQDTGGDRERKLQLIESYINVNPDKPLWEQYMDYMIAIFQGDFGTSIFYGEDVTGLLADAVPWTIFYASIALLGFFIIGIAFGGVLGFYEGTRLDSVGSILAMVANSVPYYIAAFVFLIILGYDLQWFPTRSKVDPSTTPGFNIPFILSAIHHAMLPVFSLVVTAFGGVALSMRGNAISVIGSDYLRVGRLRGLSDRRLALRYVTYNSVLPLYTALMISLSFIFGGSVVLEQVFKYSGAGQLILQAVLRQDVPLLMGAFIIITFAVVIGVFIADLTYGMIDPRIDNRGGERESF